MTLFEKVIAAAIAATLAAGTIASGAAMHARVKAATETITPSSIIVIAESIADGDPDTIALVEAMKQGGPI